MEVELEVVVALGYWSAGENLLWPKRQRPTWWNTQGQSEVQNTFCVRSPFPFRELLRDPRHGLFIRQLADIESERFPSWPDFTAPSSVAAWENL